MVQIMQSYKNKNMVSRVFVSTLCKRRQEEAEAAINCAIQRLQVGVSSKCFFFAFLVIFFLMPSVCVFFCILRFCGFFRRLFHSISRRQM